MYKTPLAAFDSTACFHAATDPEAVALANHNAAQPGSVMWDTRHGNVPPEWLSADHPMNRWRLASRAAVFGPGGPPRGCRIESKWVARNMGAVHKQHFDHKKDIVDK